MQSIEEIKSERHQSIARNWQAQILEQLRRLKDGALFYVEPTTCRKLHTSKATLLSAIRQDLEDIARRCIVPESETAALGKLVDSTNLSNTKDAAILYLAMAERCARYVEERDDDEVSLELSAMLRHLFAETRGVMLVEQH